MTPDASRETARLLELSFLPGVGTVAVRKAVQEAFQTAKRSLWSDASVKRSSRGKQNKDGWQDILTRCARGGISVLSPLDCAYPAPLRHVDDFPPFLYVKGDSEALKGVACAVVGTREASKLGLSWARQIAETLAASKYCIVSGLALGIDTAAHHGALRGKGRTVAVLAHGLDQITPASNKPLAHAILDAGGAFISEHPPGVPPRKAEYVRRNRIQSGMSVCSVVVESGAIGGAIHQGNFTFKQGRRLFCVVPPRTVPGANEFRYDGAQRLMTESSGEAITSREDLMHIISSRELEREYRKLDPAEVLHGALFATLPSTDPRP